MFNKNFLFRPDNDQMEYFQIELSSGIIERTFDKSSDKK